MSSPVISYFFKLQDWLYIRSLSIVLVVIVVSLFVFHLYYLHPTFFFSALNKFGDSIEKCWTGPKPSKKQKTRARSRIRRTREKAHKKKMKVTSDWLRRDEPLASKLLVCTWFYLILLIISFLFGSAGEFFMQIPFFS